MAIGIPQACGPSHLTLQFLHKVLGRALCHWALADECTCHCTWTWGHTYIQSYTHYVACIHSVRACSRAHMFH